MVYLASTQKAHSREFLGDLLWNDRNHERSLGNLRILLNRLPQSLASYVVKNRQHVSLDVGRYWIDITTMSRCFEPLLAQRNMLFDDFPRLSISLEQGLALFNGDFLSGFYLSEASRFDEWLLVEQERYRRQVVTTLRYLCTGYLRSGDYLAVERHARQWVKIDSYAEEAYRYLMHALLLTGRRNTALAEYEVCRRILADELHIAPEAQTTALYENIRLQGAPPILIEQRSAVRNRLPAQLTPFIGREGERDQIIHQLAKPDCRLLTIVGLPGIGKTRLALAAAETQLNVFADGVYFVSLASISSASLLVSTIAEAAQFAFYASEDLPAQLLSFLRGKTMLFVLDNFEHLLDGVGLLLDILAQAPGVKLLVTSRERLNIQPEWLLDLRGLSFPPVNSVLDQQHLQSYQAIQLFIQTAQRVRADFSVQNEAADIVRICQLIGGMPLGIEMAATWVTMLSCHQIALALAQGLDLLSTTQRHIPARQQNMRAVFEHSWNLITSEEQAILMKLSIFRGGFSINAASEVANGSLRILSALVDKSLLQPQRAGRFQMHELLRQYAQEKLIAAGQFETAGDLHFAYFSALTRGGELKLHSGEQAAWRERFDADYDNLCAALHWSETHPDRLQAGLQMVGDLFWFWVMGAQSKEGYAWCQKLLTTTGAEAWTRQRSWALHGTAALAFFLTNYQASITHITESLHIAESIGDQLLIGQALYGMTAGLVGQNRTDEALPIGVRARDILRQFDNQLYLMIADNALGQVYIGLQEFDNARAKWEQLLHWSEFIGNQWFAASAYYFLGVVLKLEQDFETARSYQVRAVIANKQLGDRYVLARAIMELAEISVIQTDDIQARKHYQDALTIAQDQGYDLLTATCLYELGRIASRQGIMYEAQSFFEQSLAIYKRIQNQAGIEACLTALAPIGL